LEQHHLLGEELADLMQHSGQKGLTLLCPLHPANPDRSTDRLTLKHLAQEAAVLIKQHWPDKEAKSMNQQLERMLDQLDLVHTEQAIAIYLNPTYHRIEKFHFAVPPVVQVDARLPIRELLWRVQLSSVCYVLSLSEHSLELFEVREGEWREVRDHFFPHRVRDDFEYARPVRSSSYAGHAHVKMFERDKLEMQHLRLQEAYNQADDPLTPYLLNNVPLIIAGADRDLAIFRQSSRHADQVIGQVSGNYQVGHRELFQDKVNHLIHDHAREAMENAVSDFLEKWGTGMAKCGLADCWNAVEAGQGLVLQVERGYRAPMYRSAQGQFSTTDESNGSIYMPDALDELMERTLRKGGKVLLVDNNLLATAQRVALVLRYPTKLPV